ncbi:transcriptional repressor [Candidozyma auris]|uniref:C2H2-type domain-containing protein n=1 Tax=Candidozyma auris TaxID=498019 RepID=A0A8F2W3J2_CANAR|nr:hypothetical_protein [[Candida] auris]QEO23942.1 hypothetical_protein [[Candida] auris]QWW24531.1 hypothetical protein CA7LBN_003388 [[Candida] auris]GBL52827.1 hypothetical protein CAJCM15448_51010 [[Candida] auris]
MFVTRLNQGPRLPSFSELMSSIGPDLEPHLHYHQSLSHQHQHRFHQPTQYFQSTLPSALSSSSQPHQQQQQHQHHQQQLQHHHQQYSMPQRPSSVPSQPLPSLHDGQVSPTSPLNDHSMQQRPDIAPLPPQQVPYQNIASQPMYLGDSSVESSSATATPASTSASTSNSGSSMSSVSSVCSYSSTEPRLSKRKHACKTCGRSFTTSGHLARHFRTHTGERKHVCPWADCGARFARQDNCMQHYKTHLNGKNRRSR